MGSKSKSSSAQTTNNTSTSMAAQGDNNGFMTNGNGNSFNIQQVDGGLVQAVTDVWGDMAANQGQMITSTENMAQYGFDAAQGMTESGFNFASDMNSDSLNAMQNVQSDAFNFGADAINAMQDTQTGAFNFGSDALAMTGNLATDSINAQNALAETSIEQNSDLALSVAEMAENMNGNNTAFANNAILTVSDSLGAANNNMADLAYYSVENNSNLARDFAIGSADLAALTMESTKDAYEGAADQTLLAHKQALQFANNATRSDGQQLAVSTNETMKYIVIGLGGVAIVAMFTMGRK